MDKLTQDLRHTFRRLVRSPGFTFVAVVSLALGIGANTAIFSVIDGVFSRDTGLSAREELIDIFRKHPAGDYWAVTYRDFEEVRENASEVLRGVTAYGPFWGRVERGGGADRVFGELVTGEYFEVLGARPVVGRGFVAEEDETPGTHPVVVLGHRYWTSAFGADPGVVGRDIRLNGRSYTVVGVAPSNFPGKMYPGASVDLFVPLSMAEHLSPGLGRSDNLSMTARLGPGVTVAQARAVIDALARSIDERRADSRSRYMLSVASLADFNVHPGIDRTLKVMAGMLLVVVGLVLLIACTNLASLLLARAADRQREVAVRLALGAGRRALIGQLLTESLVLGLLGGAAGLVLGVWVARALVGLDLPVNIPLGLDVSLDVRVLAFTFGVSVLAAVLFGLAPAIQATRPELASTLRGGAAGVIGGAGRFNLRNLLVVGQVSLALVLLIGAGLFLRSLHSAASIDVGFSTGPAAVVAVDFHSSGYDEERRRQAAGELVRRIRELPGVTQAGGTARLLLGLGIIRRGFEIPGVDPPPGADSHGIEYVMVTPGLLETLEIPVLRGRGIADSDRADGQRVALMTQAGAERYWPGEDPVGKVLRPAGQGGSEVVIVGITGDVKVHSLGETPQPYMFVPIEQEPASVLRLVARGERPVPQLLAAMQGAVETYDPDLFVSETHALVDHVDTVYYLPRMAALLLTVVGALGLTLAVIGLYGVVSYAVARRTREMGIRIALGARPAAVVGLVMRGGFWLVGAGTVIGLGLAFGVTRFVRNFLIGVSWADPLTFVGVPAVLIAVAVLAAYVPARRASRVDPIEALRPE